jgi:hypothetical protein
MIAPATYVRNVRNKSNPMNTNTGNRCITLICKDLDETNQPRILQQDEARIKEWQELFPKVDAYLELQKASAWLESQPPSKRKTLRGMRRFLLGWLERAGKPQNPWEITPKLAEIKHTPEDKRGNKAKIIQSAGEFQRTRGVTAEVALEMAKRMWE